MTLQERAFSALVRRFGWVDANGVGHGGGLPDAADVVPDDSALTQIVGYSSDPYSSTDVVWFKDNEPAGDQVFDWM